MTHIKDFDGWNILKQQINAEATMPTFKEREVWWCSIGVNVGHEMDGKNAYFDRPVLVIRKFNKRLFWGVPLSSQVKESPHYYPFTFKGKEQSALLTQMRLLDSARMTNPMGQLSSHQFDLIVQALAAKLLKR